MIWNMSYFWWDIFLTPKWSQPFQSFGFFYRENWTLSFFQDVTNCTLLLIFHPFATSVMMSQLPQSPWNSNKYPNPNRNTTEILNIVTKKYRKVVGFTRGDASTPDICNVYAPSKISTRETISMHIITILVGGRRNRAQFSTIHWSIKWNNVAEMVTI